MPGSVDLWVGLWAEEYKAPGSPMVPGALLALEALPRRYAAMDRMVQAPRSRVNRKREREGYGRWFKHDSTLRCHPKIMQVGPLGELLYLHSIEYANQYLTDGFIPERVLMTLVTWNGDMAANPSALADELVNAGLFHVVPGGWRVHDFLDFSTSKREVMRLSKVRAKIGEIGGGSNKSRVHNVLEQANRQANSKQSPSKVQAELEREIEREKKQELQASLILKASSTNGPPDGVPPVSSIDSLLERNFLEFWTAYPSAGREKKPFARKAYRAARKRGHGHRTIMAGLAAWIDSPRWQAGRIAHAKNFCDGEMYNDDPYAAETERELAEDEAGE